VTVQTAKEHEVMLTIVAKVVVVFILVAQAGGLIAAQLIKDAYAMDRS